MARKTYKKKSSAKRARKKSQGIYKVKSGWRIGRRKKIKRRRKRKR